MKTLLNTHPLVTVIITAYNAERSVGQAVQSILHQTYTNLEIILVNDGSTDGTLQELQKLKALDKRVKLINLKQNLGPSIASNMAIDQAKGIYIARMDADDISLPQRIEKQVTFLQKHPEVVIVGSNCKHINEYGEIVGVKKFPTQHKDIYQTLFIMDPIQHPSCMINKQLLPGKKIYYRNHALPPYDLASDFELIFELAQYGKLANLSETLLFYRLQKNSLSHRDPKKTFEATLQIRKLALNNYGYQPSLKSWIIHFAQVIVMKLIPSSIVFPLFRAVRMYMQPRHKQSRQLPTVNTLLKSNFGIYNPVSVNTVQ